MGLHRDGENFGLSPFESEMRRRIWWQIVLIDVMYAMLSGLGRSLLPQGWNTRKPSNLTDTEMFPSMETIIPRETPTDMIYCMISYELGKLLMQNSALELVITQNGDVAQDLPDETEINKARKCIDDADSIITQMLDKHYDPLLEPLHQLAKSIKVMFLANLRELVCAPQEQPEWGTEVFTAKDNVFKLSVTTFERILTLCQGGGVDDPFQWMGK